MSISLFSVLKLVPWGEVISKAPEIADGARKLWRAVARKPSASEPSTSSPQPALSSEAQSLVILQTQLAAAEAELSDLHNQMLESTELINALADQNAQLIKRFEMYRIRVVWLAGIVAVLGVIAAYNLAMTFAR
jgi:hypothetical protein